MHNFAISKPQKIAIVLSLKNLKIHLAKKTILKNKSQIKRSAKFINLDEAHSVLVLFELKDEQTFKEVERFAESLRLRGKQVKLWCYYPQNKLPLFFTPTGNQQCLTRKQLKWFPIPNEKAIAGFNEIQPDILIDLSQSDCYPMKYLATISGATLKVGENSDFNQFIFDLLIQKDDHLPLTNFIQNVTHYLTHINKT